VTSTPEIIRAERGQAGAVSALIAEAFVPLDPTVWLVPDPEERRHRLEANFLILVEHAFDYGHVEVTGDYTAAAVWFHHDRDQEVPEPPGYAARLADAAGPHLDRFRALDDALARHHPHGVHHYLALLAVRPEWQGYGIGSALMQQHLRRLDRAGLPAYLEASSARSRDLYLRYGYRVRGEPFHLPDGPPFWPMWRAPGF
jgi:GNAT superfamily N-acetyltransferase